MNVIGMATGAVALIGAIGGGFVALESHFPTRAEFEVVAEEVIYIRLESIQIQIKRLSSKSTLTQSEKDYLEALKRLEQRLIRKVEKHG